MARYDGTASIRRAVTTSAQITRLDVRPDGQEWRWVDSTPSGADEALACGLTALSGGWLIWLTLPDDPQSNVIEAVGLTNRPDRELVPLVEPVPVPGPAHPAGGGPHPPQDPGRPKLPPGGVVP